MAMAEISPKPAMIKDACKSGVIFAVVAMFLALPLLGFETVQVTGGLTLVYRWIWVAIATGVGFCTGFIMSIWAEWLRLQKLRRGETSGRSIGEILSSLTPYIAPIAIILAILLPLMPFADRRLVDVATLILTYIMLGWGLNIVIGLAGLLDLGYVAFYAVGAYSFALFALHFDLGFWICLPLAGLLAATFGCILGFPVLRLRGDYLAIVTLGFGEIIRLVLINWYDLTRGPDGLSGIPRPTFFGLPFTRKPEEGVESFHQFFSIDFSALHRIIFLYYIILFLALITNAFTLRIRKLPIGRAWEALREDEIACRALGINPVNTKLTAFTIGAMFGGFAGSFFATRQGFISPESFTFLESAIIVAIVVLGGGGSQIGVVIATLVIIGLMEWLRGLEEFRMLIVGGLLVLVMNWRPRGLFAFREPTIRLVEKSKRRWFGRRQTLETSE